jgi:hypothetical protein
VRRRRGDLFGEMNAAGRLCRLEQMEGREVACPEEKCAFWEPGGKAVAGRCVLHGVDFQNEPGLAKWLREFRDGLAREAKQ